MAPGWFRRRCEDALQIGDIVGRVEFDEGGALDGGSSRGSTLEASNFDHWTSSSVQPCLIDGASLIHATQLRTLTYTKRLIARDRCGRGSPHVRQYGPVEIPDSVASTASRKRPRDQCLQIVQHRRAPCAGRLSVLAATTSSSASVMRWSSDRQVHLGHGDRFFGQHRDLVGA